MSSTKPETLDDSARYPYAQEADGMWHKRPAGDPWIVSYEEPQCQTLCGKAIYSVQVSDSRPEAGPRSDSALCACVDLPGQ